MAIYLDARRLASSSNDGIAPVSFVTSQDIRTTTRSEKTLAFVLAIKWINIFATKRLIDDDDDKHLRSLVIYGFNSAAAAF